MDVDVRPRRPERKIGHRRANDKDHGEREGQGAPKTGQVVHGREIVTASDGTFVIQFNGGIKPTGSTTSEVNGRFVLKKGTGAYSKLHSTGKIHATLDSASGSITAVDRERRTSTAVARRGGAAAAPLHGTRWIPRAHNTFAGGSTATRSGSGRGSYWPCRPMGRPSASAAAPCAPSRDGPTPAQNDPAIDPPVAYRNTPSTDSQLLQTFAGSPRATSHWRLAPQSNAAEQSATDPDAFDLESFGTDCTFTARGSSSTRRSRAHCAHRVPAAEAADRRQLGDRLRDLDIRTA